jgi:hypothetical protein
VEGAEGVVLDLCVRGGRALAHEVEVHGGLERGRVEQDEPDVDAQFGLERAGGVVSNWPVV